MMKPRTPWWISAWILAVSLCALFPPTPAPAETALVAWWPGNGTTQDVAGGNHGVLQSGATYGRGVFGQGFHFDGIDDRINVSDWPGLALTQSLTISGWIYLDNLPPGPVESMILFRGDNRAGLDPYYLGASPTGRLVFHIESAAAPTYLAAPVPLRRFIHVAGTLDHATSTMRLYVNGEIVAQQITGVRPLGQLDLASNPAVGIGNHGGFPNTPFNYPFPGTIDELKLYSRALSPTEIRDAFRLGLTETLVVSGFNSGNVARFGGSGALMDNIGVNQLNLPAGTAYGPDGNLYVASLGDDQILEYDGWTGELIGTFVTSGSGGLNAPEGIVFGPDRHLYVASRLTHQVLRYHGSTGAFMGVFASGGGLAEPFDLVFDPDCHLYVSSRGSGGVIRYHGKTGAFIDHFVAPGAQGLQLDEPRGIAFGPDGNLYVVSPRSDRVLCFNGTTGAFLGNLIAPGTGGLDEPAGIRFGPDGLVYITSTVTNDVRRFNSSGQFIDVFASGGGLAHATYLTFSPAAVLNHAPVADAGPDQTLEWDGTNVLARMDGTGSCDLDWDLLTYEWRRNGLVIGTGAAPLVSLPAGTHTIILTVRDPSGDTSTDSVVVTTVDEDPNPPPTPTNVTVTPLSTSQLKVAWVEPTPGPNAATQNLRVERRVAGTFTEVGQLAPGVREFVESGLPANTVQTYRVLAFGQDRFSPPSPEVSAAPFPLTPQGLAVSAAVPHRLDLVWNDPNPVKAATRVERSDNGGGTYTLVATLPAGTNTFQNSGLEAFKQYHYRLKAANTWGESAPTAPVSGTTLPPVPAAPGNPHVAARTQTMLRLAWTAPAGPVDGYRVESKIGGNWIEIGETDPMEPFLEITGLTHATPYTLRVFAFNVAGESPPSTEVLAETLPPPPGPPANLLAVAQSPASVKLTWIDGAGETSYRIERKLGAAAFSEVATLGAGSSEWTDSGLAELTPCAYRVLAVNAGGDSAPAQASATTLPLAPTGLTAQLLIRSVLLNWTDVSAAEGGYRIERKLGNGGWQLIANLPANTTTFRSDNLTAGASYAHRVMAVGPGGVPSSLPAESGLISVPLDVSPARVTVTPRSLNFGRVNRGKSKTLNLVLRNTGRTTVSVLVDAPAAPFRILSGGGLFTLARNRTRTVRVQFVPDQAGLKTGSVAITTNAAATPTLSASLRGTGR